MDSNSNLAASTFRSRAIIEREIEIASHKYQIVSDDEYLERMGSIFEPHLVALFQSLIQKTFRVLDVGANIGCTSLLFGQLSQEVVSFEPSPSTFKFLSSNVKNSNHLNIEVKKLWPGCRKSKSRVDICAQ
jgi:protein-L-isoaspartate O-methyltransferase